MPTQCVLSSKPIYIRLEWFVPNFLSKLRVGIGINSFEGTRLFGSCPEDTQLHTPSNPGHYSARICIPKDLLLVGKYSVAMCLWNSNKTYDYPDPAFHFQVYPGISLAYASDDHREGLIQIQCDWKLSVNEASRSEN